MADHAEARQDQDVDFRMTEEPEQVLEEQRIAPTFRLEKGGAEIPVRQQHGDGSAQHRQRQEQQEGGNAMYGEPISSGTNQLPKPPIIAGITTKNTMISPWAVIQTFHIWPLTDPSEFSRN